MTIKILVAYATNAGSTAEVARFIGDELSRDGAQADVRPFREIADISDYQAVLVGGPMILGWHRDAVRFVQKHQLALSRVPVAYLLMAMSLTRTPATDLTSIPVVVDPALAAGPVGDRKLSFKESFTTISHYLNPVLAKAPQVRPVSIGFFAGSLDYSKLNLLQMLFVRVIVAAQAGDRRNWDAIRGWTAGLRRQFVGV